MWLLLLLVFCLVRDWFARCRGSGQLLADVEGVGDGFRQGAGVRVRRIFPVDKSVDFVLVPEAWQPVPVWSGNVSEFVVFAVGDGDQAGDFLVDGLVFAAGVVE